MSARTARDHRRRRLRRWIGNTLFVLASIALVVVLVVRLVGEPEPIPATSQIPSQTGAVQVVRVVDGDTLDVVIDGERYRVRYIGIDSPELGESLADLATARNRALVTGQTVHLVKDQSETDRYGRLLRYVYLDDGRLINELLVQEGLARVTLFPPDTELANRLQEAEQRARSAALGIWAEDD